jgi:tetratricopeptide (TPR) repeat protein
MPNWGFVRACYEQLLWLAQDVVSRGEHHRAGRKLSRADAAREGLVYLTKAEAAFHPTPVFYAIRARCRERLGEKKAAEVDRGLARQSTPAIALDHQLRGYAAIRARNKAEAVQQFEAALRLEPTHYWSLMMLGWTFHELGGADQDLTAAVAAYTGCIMKRPRYAPAWGYRGYAYCKQGLATQAVADLSKAIELGSREASVWSNRGAAYLNYLHEYDKALADVSKAIDLEPDNASFWRNRGIAHGNLRQVDKAIADHSKAIELKTDFAEAWDSRGAVYCDHLHQYDKAIADFSKAIDLKPDYFSAWSNRGVAYSFLGQFDKAVADCSKAIQLKPEHSHAWHIRGSVYQELGEYNKAIADYSQAIQLNPNCAQAWCNRASVYSNHLHEYDKAIADLSRAIQIKPDNWGFWMNRGNTYRTLRQYEKAVEDYSKAIQLKPDLLQAWFNRGVLYSNHLHDHARAVADFSKAIDLKPDNAHSWNNRGIAHKMLGQNEKAIADHSKAIELKADLVDAWYNRGIVRAILGQYDKAVADYSKAIELDPKRPLAWYKQGKKFGSPADIWEWFLLAMAQWQLGNKADASRYFDQAIRLMEEHKFHGDEVLHLGAAAAARLGDGEWLLRWSRGLKHAEAGRWDQAAADLSKAIKDKSYCPQLWYRVGLLRLYTGDTDGYRKLCADMVKRFRQTEDEDALHHLVWTCILREKAVADFRPVLQAAEKLAAKDPKDWSNVNRLGVALCRAGRLQAAIEKLNKSEKMADDDWSRLWDSFFLARAHGRLGQAEEAKKWLVKVDGLMAKQAKRFFWAERLQAELLRREAAEGR